MGKTKDGGPDVVITLRDAGVASDNKRTGVIAVQLSDAFWHKLYAGLALTYVGNLKMQAASLGAPLEENDWTQSGIAELAYDIADAMIAHEAKDKEDDSETDNKRG